MSFDKDNNSPDQLVDPGKRTTRVNVGVVLGVLAFFIVGALTLCTVSRDPPETPPEVVPLTE